jgi:hypothetical protein
MKLPRLIAIVSLLLNAALLAEVYFREWRKIDRSLSIEHVAIWAHYAGAMQAERDFGRGVRRLYRPTPELSWKDRSVFTGTREGGAEVWTRVYSEDWDASRVGEHAFAAAYNEAMRKYLADPASCSPPISESGSAGGRSADCSGGP